MKSHQAAGPPVRQKRTDSLVHRLVVIPELVEYVADGRHVAVKAARSGRVVANVRRHRTSMASPFGFAVA